MSLFLTKLFEEMCHQNEGVTPKKRKQVLQHRGESQKNGKEALGYSYAPGL